MKDVSYAKLGGFAIAVFIAVVAAISVVSVRALTEDAKPWAVYFSESVQGLELGSAVKFRGVKIGTVAHVEVAPDGRHVRVDVELFDESVQRIGLEAEHEHQICAQLSPVGLTGMQIVQLDAAEPEACTDPSSLPFEPPGRVIASRPSTLANVETAVRELAQSAPAIAEQLEQLVDRINRLVGDVDESTADGPPTVAATLAQVQETAATIDRVVGSVDTERLSKRAARMLGELQRTSSSIRAVAERLDDRRGLMARLERASTSMGDAASTIDRSGGDLRTALRDVSQAANSIRRLADLLERDPDMLLKGRAE